MFAWDKSDLNDEQVESINDPGNVYLVACPGSGKTRALTYKIALELSRLQSNKQWIVAITYTNRAAEEIQERIEKLGVNISRLWIGTIHSFCLDWILKPYGIYHPLLRNGFRIVDQFESERRLDQFGAQQLPRVRAIDCAYFFRPGGFDVAMTGQRRPSVINALSLYWQSLADEDRIDFELILKCAYDLLVEQPAISQILNSIFAFVLVDEFQDTKEIQYDILAAILRAGHQSTRAFFVGDPNQAIYGSLGGLAMPREEFAARANLPFVPKSLSINYRSSARLVTYFSNYNIFPSQIESVGQFKDYNSAISYDATTQHNELVDEIVRLIRYNIDSHGISPNEICVVGPQWIPLASLTRSLVAALPEYSFDGPGMAPFARDQESFWFKVARLALTEPSPSIFIKRCRWANEIIAEMSACGIDVKDLTAREMLLRCNQILVNVDDGLEYLRLYFDDFALSFNFTIEQHPSLNEHHEAFFTRSQRQIERLEATGAAGVTNLAMFRRVFARRSGITISTIHGVKGAEFDAMIAFALLQHMVPHFADTDGEASAKKLLYVICSRPRKNLHLISETGRVRGQDAIPYDATDVLSACVFAYDAIESAEG